MFKKYRFIICCALIIIVVFAIFAGIQFNESTYFKELAIEQAINDVDLIAMDLNSQITNMSTEQRVVSQMMANDIFLLRWCEEENEDTESAHANELYEYLKTYQLKYNYDVVFLYLIRPIIIIIMMALIRWFQRIVNLIPGILIF